MPGPTGMGYGGPFQGLTNPGAVSEPVLRRVLAILNESRTEADRAKYASVWRAGEQAITKSAAGVQFSTATWTSISWQGLLPAQFPRNIDTAFNKDIPYWTVSSPTLFTIPQHLGGLYLVMASVGWEPASTGTFRGIRVVKVGAGAIGSLIAPPAASTTMTTTMSGYGLWPFKGGQTITIDVAHDASTNINIAGGLSYGLSGVSVGSRASIHRVGDVDERDQS